MPAENKKQIKRGEGGNRYVSEKDLVSWRSPARPFKRRNREFYVTIIAIAALFSLILFLVEGFMPVILIISLVFLFYVLSTVEPETVEYKITNRGIQIHDRKTEWDLVLRFWFTKRFDNELLIIETLRIPGRLEIVVDSSIKGKIRENMLKYVPEEETPASYMDRTANWFSRKLPR